MRFTKCLNFRAYTTVTLWPGPLLIFEQTFLLKHSAVSSGFRNPGRGARKPVVSHHPGVPNEVTLMYVSALTVKSSW